MNNPIEELVNALCRLPTIGTKSAWRLALYLMEQPEEDAVALGETIINVRRKLTRCKLCFNFSEQELCSICSSPQRDKGYICVVEKPADIFAIEKSGRYRGVYHVLGGVLSPLNGVGIDKLKIAELEKRIDSTLPHELIIALGGSADAETTALYLARVFKKKNVRVTRLARGLPAGMELEYADQITLGQALNERIDIIYGEDKL
ncbi:MAG TPA: recombination mediator RecR [Chitinispirillaceae bacterium]|nr:recombination mediator RecR [Chitinispirillaceae bacterium]